MGVLLNQFRMVPMPLINYAPEGLARGFNTTKLPADAGAVKAAVSSDMDVEALAADSGYQPAEPV